MEPDFLWDELVDAFNVGNALLTVGTGKLSHREQKQLGLAAEHDYAVLDMKQSTDRKEFLIKNPWAEGDVWKGATRRRPNPSAEMYPDLPPVSDLDEMLPGTFWMDFNSIFLHYEYLYINWNPGIFGTREDRHFSWTLPQRRPAATIFDSHHQFCITQSTETAPDIWLLLNRHFRTGDYSTVSSDQKGFISLHIYDHNGYRVLSSEGAVKRGPFVDSPNTLLRFKALKGKRYTAVVAQHDLPAGKHNFTFSLFSNGQAAFNEALPRYTTSTSLNAAWTHSNAGGNSESVRYLINPQFSVRLPSDQRVAFVLRVADDPTSSSDSPFSVRPDIRVKILLSSSSGARVTHLRPRDIIVHSGDYQRAASLIETTLSKGTYTLICSTFEEKQYSKFTLDFHSSSAKDRATLSPTAKGMTPTPSTITALPAESSGRLLIDVPALMFSSNINRMLAPITVPKTTKATIILGQASRNATTSLFKLALEQGQGPYKRTIADSSFDDTTFHPISTGLRIEDVMLHPEMSNEVERGGLWLVVERVAEGSGLEQGETLMDSWIEPQSFEMPAGARDETVSVEVLVEERVRVGIWGVGEG